MNVDIEYLIIGKSFIKLAKVIHKICVVFGYADLIDSTSPCRHICIYLLVGDFKFFSYIFLCVPVEEYCVSRITAEYIGI